ncbi:hypothetical protein KNE206_32550 [Kitasatospora sp. NE20-6]
MRSTAPAPGPRPPAPAASTDLSVRQATGHATATRTRPVERLDELPDPGGLPAAARPGPTVRPVPGAGARSRCPEPVPGRAARRGTVQSRSEAGCPFRARPADGTRSTP